MQRAYPIVFTDGGRRKDGYEYEKNDCTVRALALGCNAQYKDVWKELYNHGRKPCKPFLFNRYIREKLEKNLDILGKELIPLDRFYIQKTVGQFLDNHPKGNYLIRTNGHVFNVKDGIIYDSFKDGLKRRIYSVWIIIDKIELDYSI